MIEKNLESSIQFKNVVKQQQRLPQWHVNICHSLFLVRQTYPLRDHQVPSLRKCNVEMIIVFQVLHLRRWYKNHLVKSQIFWDVRWSNFRHCSENAPCSLGTTPALDDTVGAIDIKIDTCLCRHRFMLPWWFMKYPMQQAYIDPVFTLEQLYFSARMTKKVFGRGFACYSFRIFQFQLASTIEPCFVANRAGHVCFHD